MRGRVFESKSDCSEESKKNKSIEMTAMSSGAATKRAWPSGFAVIDFMQAEFASIPIKELTDQIERYRSSKKGADSSPAMARIERFRNKHVMEGKTDFNLQHLLEAFAGFSGRNKHHLSLAYVVHSFVRRYRHKASKRLFSRGDMGKKTVAVLREYYLMVQHFDSHTVIRDAAGAYSAIDFATIDAFCKAMPSNKTQHDLRMEWITTSRIHLR